MIRIRKAALASVLCLCAPAALAQPAPPPQSPVEVQIVRELAAVAGCERAGEVRAGSMVGGAMANAGYSRALAQLKARAADLDATHALLIDSASGMTGVRMLATAYRCPPSQGVGATPQP
jgi:hypothetical protein